MTLTPLVVGGDTESSRLQGHGVGGVFQKSRTEPECRRTACILYQVFCAGFSLCCNVFRTGYSDAIVRIVNASRNGFSP